MTGTDDDDVILTLNENEINLLKQSWKYLLTKISDSTTNILENRLGDELFFLFGRDNPDLILLRWLKARQWNVSLAVDFLLNTLEWRIKFNIRKLLKNGENDLNEEELQTNKTYHLGFDREDYPITYVHANRHFKGQFPFETTEKFIVLNMELGRFSFKNNQKQQSTVVLDMDNVAFQNLDYQHIQFMINTMQNYYPESLYQALIINAPWGFSTVWNIIKLWLDKNVSNKIHFIRNSKDLSQFIHPDFIPKKLNGNHPDFQFIPANQFEQNRTKVFHSNETLFEDCFKQYKENAQDFLDLTFKWIESNDEKIVSQRNQSAQVLSQSFTQLLPFLFSETIYHRNQTIQLPIYDLLYQQILHQV